MTRHLQAKERGRPERPEAWRSSPLWRSLRGMHIAPEGAALSFLARLARENGWSPAYAEAVIEEYRRFLYLAATGDHPVTPPEDVDRAWHLHLTYSRHYWDVLCARILGRALHHEPTAGGRDEAARHLAQYKATLWLYRETFGAPPPPGIWPRAGTRFAARPQWVDRARYWLVPKALAGRTAGAAAATALLGACTMLAANTGSSDGWLLALVFVLVVVIGRAMALATFGAPEKDNRGRCGGGGCGGSGGASGGDCNGCGGGGCGGGCGG